MKKNKKLALLILVFVFATNMFAGCFNNVLFELYFVVDNSIYCIIRTDGKSPISMPDNPQKLGYTFDGWYWDKNAWHQPFTINSIQNQPLQKNMCIYAKWNDITYNITYDIDFGINNENNISIGNSNKEITLYNPISEFEFDGWYTDYNFTTKVEKINIGNMQDVSLVAKWIIPENYSCVYVNGWSAQQEIPYQSYILIEKCDKQSVDTNDFVCMGTNEFCITHQVIGIKYDGYFEPGECYSWEMNGKTYHAYYGYQVGDQHNITAKEGGVPSAEAQAQEISNMTLATNIKTDCNLITMANSEDGNTTKDYRNFETDFVGKVVWHNYTLGKTLFILKDPSFRTRVLAIGLASCVVMVFVMASQSKLHIGFFD